MTLDEFLPLLSGVRRQGSGYMAKCPAHDDNQQSLHISSNGTGLGLKCHAGCPNASIMAVLDLPWSALFNGAMQEKSDKPILIAEYDYVDEKGHLLYQALRYQPKKFKQRQPDGQGGWIWQMNGVRRVPYMLPEVLAADIVFIVEGEKDVHTLRVHGFTATTNVGGAGKWSTEWTDFFRMKKVIIIPDLDIPGFDHANHIAASLRGVADVRYIRIWGAKDITDWFLTHDVDQFNQLVEEAPDFDKNITLAEPEPTFTWPEVPVHVGLLGQIVELLEPHTEADPVALYTELMAMYGNCLGLGPHYRVGGTYHRCNMFLAICGETAAGRKGTAHDWVMEMFRHADSEYVTRCVLGGISSGEGIIHAVRDPKTNSRGVTDEGVSDKRRLFFESELAGRTFVAMKREGNTLSAVLRQAWESANLAVATKTNDDRATGAHITIVGHATVLEMLMTLRLSDIVGGFANRFLFFVVRRSKMLPIQTLPASDKMQVLAGKLRRSLEEARKISQVILAESAVDEWIAIYTKLDKESTDDSLSVAPFLSRGAPQILRMSMILALIDGKREITVEHLRTAQGFWNYSRKSVEFMLETGLKGGLTNDQQQLFDLLEREDQPMSVTDCRTALNWNGTRLAVVKGQLLKLRMIHETVQGGTGGRPRKMLSL